MAGIVERQTAATMRLSCVVVKSPPELHEHVVKQLRLRFTFTSARLDPDCPVTSNLLFSLESRRNEGVTNRKSLLVMKLYVGNLPYQATEEELRN